MDDVVINLEGVALPGIMEIPADPIGLVIFAHGSGSSRLSPRNTRVAAQLNDAALGTLQFDLLTDREAADRENVFDIDLLSNRLAGVIRWSAATHPELPIGLFGASTGAAAALVAAAAEPDLVRAVVGRGGRPDLAGASLTRVAAPTLLIVGAADPLVLELNQRALATMAGPRQLVVIPQAGHLFEGPGELEQVAALAADWFVRHLPAGR